MVTISAVPGCRDWRNADVFVAPQNPDVCGATAKGSDLKGLSTAEVIKATCANAVEFYNLYTRH